MSRNTRLHVRSVVAPLTAAWLAAFAWLAPVPPAAAADIAPEPLLPAEATDLVPGAHLVGSGTLRFFGLQVYDGFYYSASKAYSADKPFALVLRYHRSLRGEAIATRSSEEIERLGLGTPAERERWDIAMKKLFPDVRPGDQVTGINLPGTGTRFYRNGLSLGTISDPAFGPAFFAIWFDPRTSRPEFRERLLGG
jgi:hypothetical protein